MNLNWPRGPIPPLQQQSSPVNYFPSNKTASERFDKFRTARSGRDGRDTVARWISMGMLGSEIGDLIQTRKPQGADETCGAIMDEILES